MNFFSSRGRLHAYQAFNAHRLVQSLLTHLTLTSLETCERGDATKSPASAMANLGCPQGEV